MFYCHLPQPASTTGFRLYSHEEDLKQYDGLIIPQIGLPMSWGGVSRAGEIAKGEFDDRIDALCQNLKTLNRPVFLRIGHEFNGRWNGYKPEEYIAGWRHVVTKLRDHKLDQVATVWCYASDIRNLNNMMDWYPGDAWVDWWGIDLFSVQHFTDADTPKFMRLAREHGFPVMIGESTPRFVGVEKGEESWEKWYKPYFQFIAAHEHVKAFCYINWNWALHEEWKNWGDARIERNPVVLELYRSAISHPIFQHAADRTAMEKLLGLTGPAANAVRAGRGPAAD
jgi:hypothetical protein